MIRSQALRVSCVVLAAAAAGSCGRSNSNDNDNAGATTIEIIAANIAFSPVGIALKAGQKVTLKLQNDDKVKHNLTVEDLKVNKDVEAGQSGTATITPKAGTYQFHCEYHPQQMKGTLTVT